MESPPNRTNVRSFELYPTPLEKAIVFCEISRTRKENADFSKKCLQSLKVSANILSVIDEREVPRNGQM
jgi:hypothetical protein